MPDAVRLLIGAATLATAARSAVVAHRTRHGGVAIGTVWPYAESVCTLLAGSAAIALTYVL